MEATTPSRGRFAPSPTGDLHLGSLVAALASYCHSKAKNSEWLIRIEDIDETRTVPGAAEQIIKTLGRLGMHSDQPIIYQTDPKRQAAYAQALSQLDKLGLTYPCTCTRKQLVGQQVYPGTCRAANHTEAMHSIRLKTDDGIYAFEDLLQGPQQQQISQQCGDFNIKRKDGLFCYQLAVVVDDADQGITEVVRGIDIMDSTSRQMYLIKLLQLPQPQYAHFPVITGSNNNKLSKQNHAKAITHEDPYAVTELALQLLQQKPPKLQKKTQSALLDWAVKNWRPENLFGLQAVNHLG